MSKFTRSQVATTGNSKENVLIILHDKVYNVTSFLNEHPGGEEILLDHAGKDSSEDFDDVGHSKDAFDLMKKYLVGELEDSEKKNKAPKQGWSTMTTKPTEKKEEQGSQMILIAIVVAFLAILYFVYL